MKPKFRLLAGCATLLVVGALAAFGCAPAPSGTAASTAPDAQGDQAVTSTVASTFDYDRDTPIVRVLEDGTLVQRTPNMPWHGNEYGTYWTDFNLKYLAGDARGCGACHEDLNKTVDMLSDYHHIAIGEGVDTELTVQQCRLCHYEGSGHDTLGNILHATHNIDLDGDGQPNATCFNCHASESISVVNEEVSQTMPLWDDEKHHLYRGIETIADVQGEFSYDQDTQTNPDDMPVLWWVDDDSEYPDDFNRRMQREGAPLDEDLFNNWEVSVTGMVNHEVTFKLGDLIEQAPKETRVMKMNCAMNPMGGALIANVEVTGIPVKWLIEQAGGATPEAQSWNIVDVAGHGMGMYVSYNMPELESKEPLLVYEIDGERLSWDEGYPLQAWVGNWSGNGFIKLATEIRLSDRHVENKPEGDRNPAGLGVAKGMSKPNVAIMGTPEGKCIQAGETYVFEGYADAYENPIRALEFSMDGGETWTHYDTPDTDAMRWVHWTWAWDAPADGGASLNYDGEKTDNPDAVFGNSAYVLMVRAYTDVDGWSPVPIEVMVNTKANLEEFRASVENA